MRIHMQKTLLAISISLLLNGCGSMAGNVVPRTGPTMEEVYDSFDDTHHAKRDIHINDNNSDLTVNDIPKSESNERHTSNEFHKLPNPELKIFVYPHFAGNDEAPVPGYYTMISAYDRDHYALPTELPKD